MDIVSSQLVVSSMNKSGTTDPATQAAIAAYAEGMERWRLDSGAIGSAFLDTMESSVTILLFIWMAIAPLVAIIVVITGLQGLKMLMSYMLFGIWTQTWMPVAVVINSFIQRNFAEKIQVYSDQGSLGQNLFSVLGTQSLYQDVATSGE